MSNSRPVRRGLPGEIETLDPYLANDNFSLPVVRDMYEGLTTEDTAGLPTPGVAESWTVDSSGLRYTFKLRNNPKWSNGDRVRASEFVLGMRHAVDPTTGSGSAALLNIIKGASNIIAGRGKPDSLSVEAPDENTVVIELEHPAPYLLQVLSEPVASPLHSSQTASRISAHDVAAIVDGPYRATNRVMGSYIELEKNSQYWNADKVRIPRIRYSTQESESTELHQYLAGELDLTSTIPAADLDRLKKDHVAEIQSAPFLGTVYLALNITNRPLNAGIDIRQALSMTVDREEISERVIVGATPAYGFVADGVPGYHGSNYDWQSWPQSQRLAAARSLYAKAGFSETHPLYLRMYFNTSDSINRTMLAVSEKWKNALGVKIELQSTEFRVFLDEKKDRSKWDVVRLGWFADYSDPSSFLEVFASSSKQNDAGYSNKAYDKLLVSAEAQSNSEQRLALFKLAEDQLLSEYPIIPIYFYRQRRLVNIELRGASITPLNHTRSQFLYWERPAIH